ncbi:hypothetical protein CPB84DRAFT_380676 [Gymnopilus junonius]|uniref:Uncharacterized protein n=1 Tax=Gymnopilus junonius TaxID=109634 RepID=A0A9P5NC68_GYMJU|nr:hypothetical protein CPB84DRAFT_380676 [Gymnopilus junonius]
MRVNTITYSVSRTRQPSLGLLTKSTMSSQDERSAIEQLHHAPTLSLERLAFRMDLEDLRRNMMTQRQETFQPYPPPRNSREIISIGPRHEHYSRSPVDQGHRTPAPYSTAKTTRKARDFSKRGIGRDSQKGSDHRGERAIPPSRVYE